MQTQTDKYYIAAVNADNEFTLAIKRQFGPKASRWDHTYNEYDGLTAQAYKLKVMADQKLMDYMRDRHRRVIEAELALEVMS